MVQHGVAEGLRMAGFLEVHPEDFVVGNKPEVLFQDREGNSFALVIEVL